MNKDTYNEIKDYTNNQLLVGLILSAAHTWERKIECVKLNKKCDKYKEALQNALEIEHTYRDLLIERGVIKTTSELKNVNFL